jgi:hypothetical protein
MRFILSLLLILSALPFFGQGNVTLSGSITDATTGESILGANVYVEELEKGVPTNLYGFYSLTLPKGKYTINYSFIGYQKIERSIELNADTKLNIELAPMAIQTEEAVVVGEKSANTESTDMGRVDLEVEQIKTLPALLGEVDILKTIQFMPGVQSAGEGNSGFYVRGGGPDQNLILLDNATIYNASHLFGFFSVFNADAVKNIELIKGGMPASYGGRISSVLDISLKEGNNKRYEFDGGIGLISSRFTAQGPLKKDKSSFIISGRRTYIDVLVSPFINPESNFAGTGYYFYDLNAKVNYKLSDKDQLFLSGYFGRDVFGFSSANAGFQVDIPWGNAMGSLRWNHLFNDQLFMNVNLTYSDYRFEFAGGQDDFRFTLKSGIEDWSGKVQFSWYPDVRHTIKFGADYVFHEFSPSQATAQSGDTEFILGEEMLTYSHEAAVYIQDEFDLTTDLRINAGLRYSYFAHVGPFTRFVEDENQDNFGAVGPPETIVYDRGDLIKDYGGFEPRLSARYRINERSSIKAGFAQNYQYVHLASLSPTSLPTDVWLPSTDVVAPQFGRQYSIGYFRNFFDDQYEASAEIYYKDMRNLVEYEEGAQPENNLNNNTDNQLVFGTGYSYGLELFFKKRYGDLTGWIGYTWSKTMRQFDELNGGREFPFRFDRRHDLSVIASYKLDERWEFGAAFVYATGNAITLPVSRFFYEGRVVDVYGDRNGFRMAPFHRADISATYYPQKRKKKDDEAAKVRKRTFKSSWTFSVYNLYNRQNPYFIYFGNDGNLNEGTLEIKAYQVSLFPILPSVTWNFSF